MEAELYWIIAIVTSGLMVVMVVLSLVGLDADSFDFLDFGDAFSINSLIAFVCVGAWTGYVTSSTGVFQEWVVLTMAIATGLTAYIGSIYFYKRMKKWESKGNIDLDNATGSIGTVYLTIPAKESGSGQVQIIIQKRLKTLHAMTQGEEISTGTKIIVYDRRENKLLVEPYQEN